MSGKYHEDILRIITENGSAMGVNAIQRKLDIPLSTIQKYLERQTYFKKTADRKWDLPERVTDTFVSVSNFKTKNVVEIATTSVTSSIDMLAIKLHEANVAFEHLKSAQVVYLKSVKDYKPPVAEESNPEIDNRFYKIADACDKIREVIKNQKNNIPEEYRNLFLNLDLVKLVLTLGNQYAMKFIDDDIYPIVAGQISDIDPEIIETLLEYQTEKD